MSKNPVLVCFVCLAGLMMLVSGGQTMLAAQDEAPGAAEATGQPAAAEDMAAPATEKPAAKKPRAFRGRLPMYYSGVVDEDQRKQIYAIQIEYAPRIDALRQQLAAMLAERDAKISGLLSPEQLQQIEERRAESNARRQAARGESEAAK